MGRLPRCVTWRHEIAAPLFRSDRLDRYLAKTGYDAQQTNEPVPAERPNNLWQSLPGDHGAHGRFDSLARKSSWQLWATTHRRCVTLLTGGVLSAIAYNSWNAS